LAGSQQNIEIERGFFFLIERGLKEETETTKEEPGARVCSLFKDTKPYSVGSMIACGIIPFIPFVVSFF
jgi:hypothetical protein